MADELLVLVLSAIISVLIVLVIFMTDKKEKDVKQDPLEATKEVEMVEKEERDGMPQYLNPCQLDDLKEPTGTTVDLDSESNAQCLATSPPDGPSPQDGAEGDQPNYLAPVIASTTPRSVIPPKSAYLPLPCADDLYHQILSYRLTPNEMYRCGYPRPVPKKPGRAVWLKNDVAYSSRKTCCRCGATFFITPGGEYYAQSGCFFHTGRRWGSVFTCCQASLDHPGCEFSDYHICAEGLPRKKNTPARGFVRTRLRPGVTSAVFAVDCEMCFTIRGLEVTKVTVVSWNGATVYESYVRPKSPVLDYNTSFSGVTAEHLSNVQTTLKDVQKVLLRLFTASTVLVGHGLENDLRVLKLIHDTVVDTAMVFPHRQGLPYRRSLRSLVNSYLHRDVQTGTQGHDSAEDAKACMELVLWKAKLDLNQRE